MNEFTKLMIKIANDLVSEGKEQINLNNSNASGKLSDSLEYKINGSVIEISALEYGDYLDTGTGPRTSTSGDGFYDKIKEWVKYKGIDKGAAWPIYKSILEKGTQPHPWVWRMELYALNKIEDQAMNVLSTVVNDKFLMKFDRFWATK